MAVPAKPPRPNDVPALSGWCWKAVMPNFVVLHTKFWNNPLIADALSTYVDAVERAFDADVDSGQGENFTRPEARGTRTRYLQISNPVLYPDELPPQ
jgi:hypothetical protein